MNSILKYILIVLIFNSSVAQHNIESQQDIDGSSWGETGVYYKDVNNIFGPFVGTYKYTNLSSNTSFEIILQKKLYSPVGTSYHMDMLIGAYKYVENGVVKVDVLNDLDNNFADGRWHKIHGYNILTGTELGCNDCGPAEKRIYGSIGDPVSGSVDKIFIRKTVVNGQPAIKIFILHSIGFRDVNQPVPPAISYPLSQEIILIKQ